MTAEQKIKAQILKNAKLHTFKDGDNIDEIWDKFNDDDEYECGYDTLTDEREEFRQSGQITKIKNDEWSRCYESEQVAAMLDDGTWVGWTYYHGGGKHGEPSGMPWLENSYFVSCKETQKLVTVREFSKQ